MKYDFIKVDDDSTKLKYNGKEFEIKKTVGLLEKLQKVNNKAKLSMMKALAEQGMTAKDLIVVKKEGNKTIEDKSNLIELEQFYIGVESEAIYEDISKEFCGMSFGELIVDIGLDITNKEELEKFMTDFTLAITIANKSPSEKK